MHYFDSKVIKKKMEDLFLEDLHGAASWLARERVQNMFWSQKKIAEWMAPRLDKIEKKNKEMLDCAMKFIKLCEELDEMVEETNEYPEDL